MNSIIKLSFFVLLTMTMWSCKNQDWDFPDNDYSAVYFPYQNPARTLVLGDYETVDNTKDNLLQFSIGVTLSGVYTNDGDLKVDIQYAPELLQNLYFNNGEKVEELPSEYYTISSNDKIVISKGELQGYVDVQLNEAFLNDPLAFKNKYVIPIQITNSEADTVLQGKPIVDNADRRIASDWAVAPKDYTIYGIKFINAYHGKFLYRGKMVMKDASNSELDQVVYRSKFIEDNEIVFVQTAGKNVVSFEGFARHSSGNDGNFKALLSFDESTGTCDISTADGSAFSVDGAGKFVKEGDVWGGKKRNTIILDYKITDESSGKYFEANDTLVMRDRAVTLETLNLVVQ